MDTVELKRMLTEECAANPASTAVLTAFAMRERARSTVNLGSLYHSMKAEGYKYEKAAYRSILELLVKSKVGTPVFDRKNQLIGVKNITIKLQSLGLLAVNGSQSVVPLKTRRMYRPLAIMEPQAPAKTPSGDVVIELPIVGSNVPIRLTVSKELSAQTLSNLIHKLRS